LIGDDKSLTYSDKNWSLSTLQKICCLSGWWDGFVQLWRVVQVIAADRSLHIIAERIAEVYLFMEDKPGTNYQGCKRDVEVRDRDETKTFHFQSETRPRRW